MKNSIPTCFYPTRKIMLDDDNDFIQSILLKMHGKSFSSIHSASEALKFINEEYTPKTGKNSLIQLTPEHSINIQFEKIATLKNSCEDISILFVDYHMPEMYGLDFLKKITAPSIKKVLVTGEHDYRIAIDAFNNGLIDAYIRKDDPDFLIKLENITSELEWKYFTDLNQVIHDLPEFDYLKNEYFIKIFMHFFSDKKIKAFYLIDREGTFCTYNTTGEKEYFILRNRMQLQQLSELAAEDGASEKTIRDLVEGKAVPFFNFKEHWEIPASEWDSYLYSANKVPGDSSFLWTTIKQNEQG